MIYIYLLVAVAAALHAFMFARWLKKNGNTAGAFAVFLLAATSIALPLYRYWVAP